MSHHRTILFRYYPRSWVGRYLELAVVGMRPGTLAEKAALHLGRFVAFLEEGYGHDWASAGCVGLAALVGR